MSNPLRVPTLFSPYMKQEIDIFRRARKDKNVVVIEGVHALKHALRFGVHIIEARTNNLKNILEIVDEVAPDVRGEFEKILEEVTHDVFQSLAPYPPRTGAIAIAERPKIVAGDIKRNGGRVVFLDNPRDLENVGAVIRVAGAAGASGVVTTGEIDPWQSACVRGSAGLHFALPVMHTTKRPSHFGAPVVVFDPEGDDLKRGDLVDCGVLVFGSERDGVSGKIVKSADMVVRIPMQEKVSSLNLATSVAVAMYCM